MLFRKKKDIGVDRGLDTIRFALSVTGSPIAPNGRNLHHSERENMRVMKFFTRGLYPNDLVRIDDYINELREQERKGELDFTLTQKSIVKPFSKPKLTKNWARNFQLLQELIGFAHIALDERRESQEEKDDLFMLVNFQVGNHLYEAPVDYNVSHRDGISVRFLFFKKDQEFYESYAYINNGVYRVTRPETVTLKKGINFDKRAWPKIDFGKFMPFDETMTRAAGRYLIYESESLNMDLWHDEKLFRERSDIRVKPSVEDSDRDEFFMSNVSLRSMLVANYVGIESLILAFAFMAIAHVGSEPGFLSSFIPAVITVGLIALMAYIAYKMWDTITARNIFVVRDKPSPKVWVSYQFTRIVLTLLSTSVLFATVTIIAHRVVDQDNSTNKLFYPEYTFSVYTLCVFSTVIVWILINLIMPRNIHTNPVTDRMNRLSVYSQVVILMILGVVFLKIAQDSAVDVDTLLACLYYTIGITIGFFIIRLLGTRFIGKFAPLRSLEAHRYTKYCYEDTGTTRKEYEAFKS